MSIVCKICGMVVNDKNYDFNKDAMPFENRINEYKCCPFCGAHEEYFSSNKDEIFKIDLSTLTNNDRVILDHAAKLEVFNGDFYTEAAQRSELLENKNMFKALANIEYIHAKVHMRLLGEKGKPQITLIKYDRLKNDKDFINEANQREQHAVKFYEKSINATDNEIIERVMRAFMKIEGDHIRMTE